MYIPVNRSTSPFAHAAVQTSKDPNDPALSVTGEVNGADIGVSGKWEPASSSNS